VTTGAFWESVSGKLAERWTAELLTPAAMFWASGFAAWVVADGWDGTGPRVARWFDGLSGAEQVVVAAGGLLCLIGSAGVVEQLTFPILRLLEGYWPSGLGPLKDALTRLAGRRMQRDEARLQALEAKRRAGPLNARDASELVRLDERLRRFPAAPESRMPTKLGNVLRAGESWPRDKYGLDAAVCWPSLWLLLSDAVRDELVEARKRLDTAVALAVWGALLAVWTFLTWWALPAAVVVYVYAYWSAVRAAAVHCDLVESTFDLFRGSLYGALRFPQPVDPAEERRAGAALTAYLWRGVAASSAPLEPPGNSA